MKKSLFFFFFFLSLSGFAQESLPSLPPSEPTPQSAPSQVPPQDKRVFIQAYLGVFGVYKTVPAGLSLSYIVNPHLVATAELSEGSNSWLFDGGRNTQTTSFGLQYFPKPFEHSRGRLYYRLLLNYSKLESEEFVFLSTEDWSYNANAFSTTLSLGYQQIYQNGLTFSFDLIGVHIPVTEKFENERFTNAMSAGLMRDNQKNIFNELTLTLLWLYIGYAF
jgi:hypothetical protein